MASFPAPSRRQFPASWPEAAVVTSPVHRAGARGRGRSRARAECRPGREAGSLAGGEFPAADVGPAQPSSRRRGAGRPSCRSARDRPQRPALPAPARSHRSPRRIRPRRCCGEGLGRGSRERELGVGFGSAGTAGAGRSQREKAACSREIPLLQMKYSGFREVTSTYSASECWREINFKVGRNPIDHLVHLPRFTHEENEARKVWFCPVGSII
ncbi:uncharacterized protein LOC111553483 [Piliocolobus tephrosceles]|uniref:uncharacterized protein LOC111553483 n=1 Tax=Piliocolobus tephrosceles TaxID=591936 RepID=UPI0013012034|nr:uncharacterized protein LOC111553483 [Piliocolobus tephrosceles]